MMPGADTSKSRDKYLNQSVQEYCRLFCTQLKIAIIWILEKNLYVRIPRRTSLSSRTSSWIKLAVWIISVISARRRCCGCKALQIYQIDLATWFYHRNDLSKFKPTNGAIANEFILCHTDDEGLRLLSQMTMF
jgi:hypothetical protein